MDDSDTQSANIEMLNRPHKPGFPEEIGLIFDPLLSEIIYLHGNWQMYQALFLGPGCAEAIKTTPAGFGMIRYTIRHEIIMGFSRITDPKATGTKENLTLQQLMHAVSHHCDDVAYLCALGELETKIANACTPFKDIRNRSIAHLDLKTFLKNPSKPLPGIDEALIEECLNLLREFMRSVGDRYTTVEYDFELHISPPASNIIHDINEYNRLQHEEYLREK